jgi:hypothetical protein
LFGITELDGVGLPSADNNNSARMRSLIATQKRSWLPNLKRLITYNEIL